ncbi:MAG: GvpL/GvpF family gas vesicle protein [Acidobacteria bacterium]|nr:GvpL/GvpF family gas vesicle protein [Acidobacteriota bacterium]
MRSQATPRCRKYLYAIVAGDWNPTASVPGINGSSIHTIRSGAVAAVVSDVLTEKIRPQRCHLAVHQEALKRVLAETTPLPVSFGIIADDAGAIRTILIQNQETFLRQLHQVQGRVEMGVRVTWDTSNFFEFFINRHSELRAARDRLFGGQRRPTQEDRIQIGQLFERILNEDRDVSTDKVEDVLSRECFEIKRNKCRNDSEVMNLACLAPRGDGTAFEAAVLEAAKLFDNNFAFDYNGPWAPHNFVDLDLQL